MCMISLLTQPPICIWRGGGVYTYYCSCGSNNSSNNLTNINLQRNVSWNSQNYLDFKLATQRKRYNKDMERQVTMLIKGSCIRDGVAAPTIMCRSCM